MLQSFWNSPVAQQEKLMDSIRGKKQTAHKSIGFLPCSIAQKAYSPRFFWDFMGCSRVSKSLKFK